MSPMKSQAQRGYLHANEPATAAEFEAATPKGAELPEHVKEKKDLINVKKFNGIDVFVETGIGEERYWYDPLEKKSGKTKMKNDYGYIMGAPKQGADGDAIDVYLGPNEQAENVYVVHQHDPNTKKYDEDKVMLGFTDAEQAKKAYLEHYNKPDFFGNIETMSFKDFEKALLDSNPNQLKLKNKNKKPKYISGDIIEISEKMKKGDLQGPIVTESCFLINMRITGTGDTIRDVNGKNIIFNRPAGIFLSDKFLKMCNGLPVVWYHPENKKNGDRLDFQNWKEYSIGTIVMPYIRNDEVWGIAKIFDLTKLPEIYYGVDSTSPLVFSNNVQGKDGRIDESLLEINHVAIVPNGHWDQIAKVPAIEKGEIIFKEETNMAEEIKKDPESPKKEDAAMTRVGDEPKKDAENPLNKAVETPAKKMDEAEQKKLDDAKKDDEKKKLDDDAKKKADDDAKAKKDAEGGELEALKKQVADLTAELAKYKTAEKGEGQAFKELGEGHEALTADDDEKEQLINAVSELADSAHSTISIKRPTPKQHENMFSYLNRVLTMNKAFVQPKYHSLLGKLDSATVALGKDAFEAMKKDILNQTNELNKSSKVKVLKVPTPDGAITDINYGIRK